jgi:carboxypeptidase C (cathepsin A)
MRPSLASILRAALVPILMVVMIVHAPSLRADEAASPDASDTPDESAAPAANPGGARTQRAHEHEEQEHETEIMQFMPGQQRSTGSVTIGGQRIDYVAYAGTIVVHPRGWSDVPQDQPATEEARRQQPEASMFYVAYFRVPAGAANRSARGNARGRTGSPPPEDLANIAMPGRPITFLYNGGPGSSSAWLHMGAFGPRRVLSTLTNPMRAAPYALVNNNYSLLDASDLVFVDAPGTGFSRIAGKDHDKAFYGVDQDAYAFSDFIAQFLSKYGRWNAPKFLFGESYGTTRSAVVTYLLENDRFVDLNGVMLLSQILNFDNSPDGPQTNPGVELPYELALPTYAATAWFHHKLPGPQRDLQALLTEVEHYAMNDYAHALEQGAALSADERNRVAQQLHQYTGLPVDYILKANLRINGGEFEKNLNGDNDQTTGRLDTRFVGPTFDPLSEEAQYDPQSAAISSAYVSAFNDYVRTQLHYGQGMQYKAEIEIPDWDFKHRQPGTSEALQQTTNVMPDLSIAMKYDPQLHVLLNAGYFDLATPFYEGVYEMNHLGLPPNLQSHIEYRFYQSGHMVYVNEPSLKQLHDNAAAFIRENSNGVSQETGASTE